MRSLVDYTFMAQNPSVRVGDKCGTRTVLKKLEKRDYYGALRYLVECDCGKQSEVYGFTLKKGTGCGSCKRKRPPVKPVTAMCGTTRNYGRGCRCSACRDANSETHRRYRKTDKGKKVTRNTNLKKYGLTADEYDRMHKDHKGVCAICKQPETKKNQYGVMKLAVDHCHDTGKIRGLLCMCCNRALGLLKENENTISCLANYVAKHKETT